MTNSINELENDSKCIFLIGTNTTENHPVIGYKIRQNVLKNGAKLIVADPRRIELAELADVYLPFQPGTDVALFNGMMNVIIRVKTKGRYISTRLTAGIYQHSTLRHHYFFTIYS
jgi:formate dehydrogenase major subunit